MKRLTTLVAFLLVAIVLWAIHTSYRWGYAKGNELGYEEGKFQMESVLVVKGYGKWGRTKDGKPVFTWVEDGR